jgi:hypothetical protein
MHSRSLNKLKVLRTLAINKETSQAFGEFLAITLSEQGDLEAALRELNSLEDIEDSRLKKLQTDLILKLWKDTEDLTQYTDETLHRLLHRSRNRGALR